MGVLINGRYELDDLPIGRGGMGEVWLGHDTKLDRQVAVKFIRFPDGEPDKDYIRRFVRESRITARLEHPGVPAVYDVGTQEGRPYLVMQRIHGISVADLVAEQGALPIGWATAIAAQVCAVLTIAHEASLVHRDLKPSNLMLQPDGAVKVLDFGLAAAPTLSDFSKITATGLPPGTPAYMAPEQIQTNISGPATDLYSLGCTLHEMLTGDRLFSGSTSFDVWSKQVSQPPPPVRGVRDEVPEALEELLLHLLQKQPEDRPAGAHIVYDQLLPYATGLGPLPGVLHPPSTTSPTRMYGTALSRVFMPPPSAPPVTPPPAPAPPQPDPPSLLTTPPSSGGSVQPAAPPQPRQGARVDRDALHQARDEAARLARTSRLGQAAELLTGAVESAAATLGTTDDDVLRARLELADVLFDAGDYRRAAPTYEQLADDIARRDGRHAEFALKCRLRGATCRALFGETSEALRQLDALLGDESEAYGPDDPRTLELRRQIGLLQLGARHWPAAEATLRDLLKDLTRLRGATHPSAVEVAELLSGLSRSR
ncbi:serine/threonine protein kinase [Micromonospora luteifusca]|uniref:non-specific serine/threonine protein kinase n=1 Tax=Micromonospora luteifusca TaxID=709860 RepID=A0ABS2LLT8_9ACTN|nr:serine/threonine-protein kinase [Micromonospora luteifusca]MBM7489140.1 serine/threonine protein kinase [Micromonospora luteifusca]